MNRFLLSVLLIFPAATTTTAASTMRFASPLQALTIWDDEGVGGPPSPRDLYLEKFKAGLEAEHRVRQDLKKKHDAFLRAQPKDADGPEWAARAARYERARTAREERMAERAYDDAVARVEAKAAAAAVAASSPANKNQYQFVGVINKDKKDPVSWYARKKPSSAKWSLRLVHVNKDAIIKDLFSRGKVDVFCKYKNKGFKAVEPAAEGGDAKKELQVAGEYEVRERSWRTLWNFSPKHFFTDSSGMYWRERRLSSGIYTDGTNVYETSYRYKDGRNGVRRVSTFAQFLQDSSIDKKTKSQLLKRIQKDHPDIVIEG